MMASLVGEFSADSTWSESPSLPLKLAVNVTSLSGSTVRLGDAVLFGEQSNIFSVHNERANPRLNLTSNNNICIQ